MDTEATNETPLPEPDWLDPEAWRVCPDGQHLEWGDDDVPGSARCVGDEEEDDGQ